MCSTLRSSYWIVEALKYLGQRQGGETWNDHRMAHAHRAWYGNSAEDISVPSTEISTRLSKVSVLTEYGSECLLQGLFLLHLKGIFRSTF